MSRIKVNINISSLIKYIILRHDGAKVGDPPYLAYNGTVSKSHYGQRNNEHEDEHIKFVNLPKDGAFPIPNAPISRHPHSHW